MTKSISALYENGVFKPLAKVRLKNKQRVQLTVVTNQRTATGSTKVKTKRRRASMKRAATAAPLVGIFKSAKGDLAKHHDDYLYR